MAKVRLSGIMFREAVRVPGLQMCDALTWSGESMDGRVHAAKGKDCVCTLDEETGLITVERVHQGEVQRVGFHVSTARYWGFANDVQMREMESMKASWPQADAKKGKAA